MKKALFIVALFLVNVAAAQQVSPYELQLDKLVQDAVAARDYDRARNLAVTARQKQFVEQRAAREPQVATVAVPQERAQPSVKAASRRCVTAGNISYGNILAVTRCR